MHKYPKIKTVYLRDPENKYKTLLEGQWATPEFEYLKDNTWQFQEKINGTNVRVMWDGLGVRFGGRTDKAQMPTFLYDKLQDLFSDIAFARIFPVEPQDGIERLYDVCLYGEGYGARIQKGGGNYIPDGVDFILFDVRVESWWLKREDVEDIAEKFGIGVVPILGYGTLEEGAAWVQSGEVMSEVSGLINFPAEGLVLRPEVDLCDRQGKRILAKIKYKDFRREK